MIARNNVTSGWWWVKYPSRTESIADTSSGLVYVPHKLPAKPQKPEPHSNRRPEWWRPLQPRREKRPLSVRLWQAEQTRRKKAARTSERRERKSRA